MPHITQKKAATAIATILSVTTQLAHGHRLANPGPHGEADQTSQPDIFCTMNCAAAAGKDKDRQTEPVDIFVRMPLITRHYTQDKSENGRPYISTTPGLMLGVHKKNVLNGDLMASTGLIINSFGNVSPAVSAEWYPYKLNVEIAPVTITSGLGLGAIYYPEALKDSNNVIGDGLLPVAGLALQFNTQSRISGFVNYIPGDLVDKDLPSVLTLGIQFKLK